MTPAEMRDLFRFKMDKLDTFQTPNFLDDEVNMLLNSAVRQFVKTRYSGMNAKQESFETSQKRVDDLFTLVKEKTFIVNNATYDTLEDAYIIPLSSVSDNDYWIFISDYIIYENLSCTLPNGQYQKRRGWVKQLTADDFIRAMTNTFWAPTMNKPLKVISDQYAKIYFGSSVGSSNRVTYIMKYIRKPKDVEDFESRDYTELPDLVHEEIVNQAVVIALESVEQPRQSSFTQLQYIPQE